MIRRKLSKRATLRQALQEGKGLTHILDVAYQVLGNPIAIIDLCYRCLLHTEIAATDDPLWNELVEHGQFSHKTVDFFREEKFIEASANADMIYLLKSDQLKYDRVSGKLFDQEGLQIGCICVVALYKPLHPNDYDLIEIICERLSVELQQSTFYQTMERVFQQSVVQDLIEHNIETWQIEQSLIQDLYDHAHPYLHLIVAEITSYEHTLSHLPYFRALFEKMEKGVKCYIYHNNIMILVSTDHPSLHLQQDIPNLYTFFMKHHLYAGISNSFAHLCDLSHYYKQALNALNYGLAAGLSQFFFCYDDYKIDYHINLVKQKMDTVEYRDPTVAAIHKYDHAQGTAYCTLLHTYLLAGNNAQLTAQNLHLSDSELRRQLGDLEEKFGIDLNNGNQLFSIFFTIKLMD